MAVDVPRRDQIVAVCAVCLVVLAARAETSYPERDNLLHVGEFAHATQHVAMTEAHPHRLVAVIEVGVEMHYGDRAPAGVSAQDREAHCVVASRNEWQRAAVEDRLHGGRNQ